MKCDPKYIEYMHNFLDEDLILDQEKELRTHLQHCSDCQKHFHELKKTIALVQSTSHIHSPFDFTAKVMQRLPQEKKVVKVKRWLKIHPLLTAAAVFFILMLGSITTMWNEDQQLAVSKQSNLLIEENTVIVPEGTIVDGDLVVRNGDIKIEGEVRGDLTLINGDKYLASAGAVTGEIHEIDQMFEWIWYHLKKGIKETVSFFNTSESK
ncbi:anti-sigma factor family protein [Bacillus sp. DJP31]|uniref:anti-sigma factor family protein n=1 Tax=Bacillus sp. DJP31 TaxID=3409789 RepID=UPI003BB6430B